MAIVQATARILDAFDSNRKAYSAPGIHAELIAADPARTAKPIPPMTPTLSAGGLDRGE